MSKRRRYLLYTIVTISLAVLGNFTNLLLSSYFWGLTYGMIGLILSLIIEMYMEVVVGQKPPLKIIYGEEELKETYRKMRKDASCRLVQSIWCTRYADVPKYFKEEEAEFLKNPRLHIQRLINPERVQRDNFRTHVESSRKLQDQRKYERKETNIKEFECVVCEYERPEGREQKAIFVFNDLGGNNPGLGILLDPARHEKIRFAVRSIKSWFEREWSQAT